MRAVLGRVAQRSLGARAMSTEVSFPGAFEVHRCEKPAETAATSKEELVEYLRLMCAREFVSRRDAFPRA